MRWDWYQATVWDDRVGGPNGGVLTEALRHGLGLQVPDAGAGRWGFGQEDVLRNSDGEVVVRVLHGGRQAWPSVQGSGEHSEAVCEALRADWRHWVTRADAADDRVGPGAWEALYGPLIAFADERGLTISQAGDWHRGEAGRTLYVGSRKSPSFIRLYEKGKQLGLDPTWVRCELQVRPSKKARSAVASMTPEELWGTARWTRDVLALLQGIDVPRVRMAERRPGDDERALRAMLAQYGATLGRLYVRTGSEEAFARYLLERIAG